jgi:hypothetical protein
MTLAQNKYSRTKYGIAALIQDGQITLRTYLSAVSCSLQKRDRTYCQPSYWYRLSDLSAVSMRDTTSWQDRSGQVQIQKRGPISGFTTKGNPIVAWIVEDLFQPQELLVAGKQRLRMGGPRQNLIYQYVSTHAISSISVLIQ